MPRLKRQIAHLKYARSVKIQRVHGRDSSRVLEPPSVDVSSPTEMAARSIRFPRAARKGPALDTCTAINPCFPAFDCQICMMRVPQSPHPGLTPFVRDDIVGAGLKSDRSIPEGTFLIEYTGSKSSQPIEGPFVLEIIADELWIDGACNGNESKLINHSCDPNCILHIEPTTRRAMIFARRDIAPEEELTLNYNGELPFECCCAICLSNNS